MPANKLKLRINPIKDALQGNVDYRWELLDSKGLLLCVSRSFEREGYARQSAFSVMKRCRSAFETYKTADSIPMKRNKR